MRSTTKCFRIGKARFSGLRQSRVFENGPNHPLSSGCFSYCDQSTRGSMLDPLSMDPPHPAHSTYGTNKGMLLQLTNTCR